jgi:hypothetical protein
MDFDDFNIQDDFVSVPLSTQQPTKPPVNSIQPTISQPAPISFTPIPTPDQIPSLSPMPAESNSMKSRTVQTLISQNQDLTARLTVSLKRNIELEQKVETQEDHYQRISTQYDLMKDHMSLAQEKTKRAEFENEKLMNENGIHEKRFAELYTAYQDKIGHIQTLSYRLHRYLQYRERIKKIVRPFIMNLKNQILSARQDFISLNDKSLKQTETILELKQRLGEAVDHIQSITKKFEKDQTELVRYHEDRYQQISGELVALKGYSENQEQQNSENKKAIETYKENEVALQNKSIFFERKYTDLKNEFEQISRQFIEQKTQDNQRLTSLEIQIKETSSQFATTLDTKNKLEIENRSLNDQYQSLQLLFQDGMSKADELKRMNQAQDQINKELSQAMVEHRKKNEFLENKLAETEEDFKRKLQSLQMRFQRNEPSNPSVSQIHPVGQKELLSKIQNLLTEIQTGQTHTNLDFEEPQKQSQNPEQLVSEFGDID